MRRHYRRNPESPLSVDWMDTAAVASGLVITQFVDQQFLQPVVGKMLPAGGVTGKLADAATTAASAWGAGELVGFLSREYGNDVARGGYILAAGKAISAVVPGVSVGTPTYPASLGKFAPFGAPAALPVATATAAGAAATAKMAALPPGGQDDYPRPQTVDSDVGI